MSTIRSVVLGAGGYLPEKVLSNDELARMVETSDEWIRQRTGIRERRIAADGEFTSDLGLHAARAALDSAGLTPAEIDMIVLATATPDHTFPAAAVSIQKKLGMKHGVAFDLQAVCSGFLFGLTAADAMIRAGQAKRALVIGAETFSRILDWSDRSTCVLFGDGAGALILEAVDGEGTLADRGILAASLRSDGTHKDKLYVDGGPSTTGTVGHLRMEGREVFKHAVGMITDVIEATYAQAGIASRAALAAAFPAVAKAALADDLADDSFGERLLGKIKGLVSLRRVGADVPGDAVEAKLARAEAALDVGDLARAVDLVKSLPPQTAKATEAWLARAEAHLAAKRAVDQLAAYAVTLLGAAR